jgi:chemotaxis protein MotB
MRLNLNLLMLLSIVVLMSSCVSKKKWTQLLSEKETADQMLAAEKAKTAELEGTVAGLESEQAALKEETERLATEVSQFKSDLESSQASAAEAMSKLKLSESDLSSLKTKVQSAVSGGGFDLSPKNGRLFVTMADPILFNSGSVRVKRDYNPTLESMVAVLNGNPALRLIIEGHSDNVPVKAGVAYSDNWDVSLARAKSVVKKLVKMGVNPNQLLPTGRGEYDPLSSDNTAESRKMNRRVDFIVMPDLSTLISAARP